MSRLSLSLSLSLVVAACGHGATRCPGPAADVAITPPANVVQAEMRLLTQAMEVAIRGVGKGDVSEVAPALHRVHEAKEATASALASGTWQPSANPETVTAFVAMDEAFHEILERMVVASRAGDVAGTSAALADAMRGCDGCHALFRAPPAAAP